MSGDPDELDDSLQAAGSEWLAAARDILLVIGVIIIVVNCVYFAKVESLVGDEITRASRGTGSTGWPVDPARVKRAWDRTMFSVRVTTAGTIVVGALFVAFGLVVQKYPVTITVAGLAIYLGGAAMRGYLDPEAPLQGIAVKALTAAALAASILAATAYRREQKSEEH